MMSSDAAPFVAMESVCRTRATPARRARRAGASTASVVLLREIVVARARRATSRHIETRATRAIA